MLGETLYAVETEARRLPGAGMYVGELVEKLADQHVLGQQFEYRKRQ